MQVKKYRYFMGDFETTVYKGQVNTEVWASAVVEFKTEDVKIFHSIGETFDYLVSLDSDIIIYYHNLKFDGAFWLSYLMVDLAWQPAAHVPKPNESTSEFEWILMKNMRNKTYTYSISDMGQWYRIVIKVNDRYIEIRDSLKLLPFKVSRIGKSFATKHKKLEMEYKGFRYAGCEITPEEQQYIANDVLVVKEAMEIMFEEGHKKLTIGSCCLAEYKLLLGKPLYDEYFPNLYEMPIDQSIYGVPNAGEYIRKSYRGGWCYLAKGKEKRMFADGTTADVNSLYPSMMHSSSGNRYPIGEPTFWRGDYIPDEALSCNKFYFVRIKTRFYIKDGMLPFIQNKSSLMYQATESLETSDVYNPVTGKYCSEYIDLNGEIQQAYMEMTLTQTDFTLIKEHYELVDFEILDGCYFDAAIGIFDRYINKYKELKLKSTGALRELAKLFLNNLYGKMASSPDSSFKVAYVKEDKSLGFYTVVANDKIPGYIPCGSAITSYARNFTIRAAQKNYHGANERGFIYADTDSIHCDLKPEEIVGIRVDPKEFSCWKLESCWDIGWFVRQKTYIEHITHEDLEKIDKPYFNIKCAGMPQKCKDLFELSMDGFQPEEGDDNYTEADRWFLSTKRELKDFDVGLVVPGKLLPKRIRGGVLLTDSMYEMR